MHKFDYSFLKNGLVPAQLVNVTSSIASLKTMAEYRKSNEICKKLKNNKLICSQGLTLSLSAKG